MPGHEVEEALSDEAALPADEAGVGLREVKDAHALRAEVHEAEDDGLAIDSRHQISVVPFCGARVKVANLAVP